MPRFARLFEAAADTLHAFYRAVSEANLDGLMEMWIDEEFVTYICPDGSHLHGLDRIRAGLAKQFEYPRTVIEPLDVRVYDSLGTIVYAVAEAHRAADDNDVPEMVFSTYVMVHERGEWRIAHIHSSVMPAKAADQLRLAHAPRPGAACTEAAGPRAPQEEFAATMTTPLHYFAPRWLPSGHLQTIVPAKFGRLPAVRFERERWATPDGDFVDLDLTRHEGEPPGPPPARAVPRPRGQFGKPLCTEHDGARAGARLARRRAAFPQLQRQHEPRAAFLSLGRQHGNRLDSAAPARAASRQVVRGRRVARRQCPAALARRTRRGRGIGGRRGGGSVRARQSRGRRPGAVGRVQPGLYARVPQDHEVQGPAQARPIPRPCSIAKRCCARATSTISTTSSPRRCTATAMPTTTGIAPRRSMCSAASPCRRSCSMRATIRSCRPARCRRAPRSAPRSSSSSRIRAAMWAS